jgi:hypothetical protein
MNEPSSIGTFDEERAAGYDDRIRRVAPGYEALQAALPSVMGTPAPDARVLVVGAGTGAELLAMARELSFASAETLNDLLPEAGFAAPTRFYQFFLWGAWRTHRVDGAAGHEA